MTLGNLVTNQPVHFMGVRECEFTVDGQNLVTLRRAKLRPLAKAMSLNPDGTKQELLRRLIGRLRSSGAPKELRDI